MLDPKVCLKNVVGLVPATCDCSEEGRPADYATSTSGLFLLDRNYGLNFERINQLTFPPGVTVWDFLENMRSQAIGFFFSDLGRNIPEANKNTALKYQGFVGMVDQFNYTISGLGERVGYGLVPIMYKGLVAKIRGFRVLLQGLTDGVIDVHLSTQLLEGVTTPYRSFSFTGNTGKALQVNVPDGEPLIIDLVDRYNMPVTMFFSIVRGAFDPHNAKFHECGSCGTTPSWWKVFRPQLISIDDTADALYGLAQRTQTCSYAQYTNGLAVDLAVDCSNGWICQDWSFSADWPRTMADAIMMYGQRETRLAILQAQELSPVTIFGRDELLKEVELINANLAERMAYLGKTLPLNMSDCFMCDHRLVVSEAVY